MAVLIRVNQGNYEAMAALSFKLHIDTETELHYTHHMGPTSSLYRKHSHVNKIMPAQTQFSEYSVYVKYHKGISIVT